MPLDFTPQVGGALLCGHVLRIPIDLHRGTISIVIRYTDALSHLKLTDLEGFCEGWPIPISPYHLMRVLQKSDHVLVAIDEPSGRVVGFITAVSDGVISAYVPLLEVVPGHRNTGIGSELVRRMLETLRDLYMVDLCCDEELAPFYERFGFQKVQGMALRRYERLNSLSEKTPPKT